MYPILARVGGVIAGRMGLLGRLGLVGLLGEESQIATHEGMRFVPYSAFLNFPFPQNLNATPASDSPRLSAGANLQ